MQIETPITPHIWLQIDPVVRNKLHKDFKLQSSEHPRCVTQNGVTRIESDGHTVNDLRGLNIESMREYLDLNGDDLEQGLVRLLEMCADRAAAELYPPEKTDNIDPVPPPPPIEQAIKELTEGTLVETRRSTGRRKK